MQRYCYDFHGRCPLGRGRHNVEKVFICVCVCMCQTLLLKANTAGQDNQGGFQDGQEGKEGHQNGHNPQDGHYSSRFVKLLGISSMSSRKSNSVFLRIVTLRVFSLAEQCHTQIFQVLPPLFFTFHFHFFFFTFWVVLIFQSY